MVPAALFYDDSLIASAQDVSLVTWSRLPNARIPILFQGCETEENWIEEVSTLRDWHLALLWLTCRERSVESETVCGCPTDA
jgi:hypothetical protein